MEFRGFCLELLVLFGVLCVLFCNAADGKLAGCGGWQPTPGRGAGAVLGPEPAPCARATSCHKREGQMPEGKQVRTHC